MCKVLGLALPENQRTQESLTLASVPVDFDEQTADDWDVDMSVYYDKGTGQGVAVLGGTCALDLYVSHTYLAEVKSGN